MSLIYRAFYGTPLMSAPDSTPTNALYTFIKMIEPLISNVEYALVAGESRTPTFRHMLYKEYKATRSKTPYELIQQFPLIEEYLKKRGVKFYYKMDYEADDIIGKVAKMCSKKNMVVEIYSSDNDLLQLVSKNVSVHIIKKSIRDIVVYNEENFAQLFGLKKSQFLDYKILVGDSSDNIKGVKGVGPKTAIKLLKQFNDIKTIFKNKNSCSERIKKALEEFEDFYELSKSLVKISENFDLDLSIEDLQRKTPNKEIYDFLDNYGIKKIKLNIKEIEKKQKRIDNSKFSVLDLNSFLFGNKTKEFFLVFYPFIQDYHVDKTNNNDNKKTNCVLSYDDKVIITNAFSLFNNLEFRKLLSTKDVTLVLNSSKVFFYFAYLFYDLKIECNYEDINLVIHLLKSNTKVDLKNLSLLFNQMELKKIEKTLKSNLNVLDEKIEAFSLLVSFYIDIYYDLKPVLKKHPNIEELYLKIEKPLTSVLAKMELNGISLDIEFLEKQKLWHENKLDRTKKTIYSILAENNIKEINLDSSQQLANVLFNSLKLPKQHKKSVDINVLNKLVLMHPIIAYIIEYRKLRKTLSTYILPFLLMKDDQSKIHPYYHQTSTATGRLSTSKPSIQNLANKEKDRRIFRKGLKVASDSYLFLLVDYSQIELRILAHFSHDKNLIHAFNANLDIHKKTAATLFNKSIDNVTNSERSFAKKINFSIIYGMGSYSLANEVGISTKEAKSFLNAYYKSYPQISIFKENVIKECKKKQYVETMFGRRRSVININSSNYFLREAANREAINTKIQGSQAEILKKVMIEIANELVSHSYKMVGQIHDSLIFEVKINYINDFKAKVSRIMNSIVSLKVPLITTLKTDKTWYTF